ncbi:MAG: hypothetical protein R3B90_02485 [Planctomycetaceae bacterium]
MLAADAVEDLHRLGLLFNPLRLGRELLVHHLGLGETFDLDGRGLRLLAFGLSDKLLLDDDRLGDAFLLSRVRLGGDDLGVGEARRGLLGLRRLGQQLLRGGLLLGRAPLSLGLQLPAPPRTRPPSGPPRPL